MHTLTIHTQIVSMCKNVDIHLLLWKIVEESCTNRLTLRQSQNRLFGYVTFLMPKEDTYEQYTSYISSVMWISVDIIFRNMRKKIQNEDLTWNNGIDIPLYACDTILTENEKICGYTSGNDRLVNWTFDFSIICLNGNRKLYPHNKGEIYSTFSEN